MLTCKHSKFTLPPAITFLNCAYMSPMLKSVEKAGIRGVRKKRNPISISPDDFFGDAENLRIEFAKTINVKNSKQIVIIPSVSYGMSNVAKNLTLQKGQNIVVASEQFPSNYYIWKTKCDQSGASLKVVSPPDSLHNRGGEWNQRILEAIDKNTVAVALGHVHWADGTKFNLVEIRKRSKDVHALLIIDGTQSVGALPFDVQTIQPDALICAGYKWLLGPYSIGLAYYSEHFNQGRPIEENWINRVNSENFNELVNYRDEYQDGALRYEVGERSNFILVPMMMKALEQINRWKPEFIQEYCAGISSQGIVKLQEHGYWIEDSNSRASHLFGVRFPKEENIDAIKQELLKKRIYVSFRGDAMRVAPNVYNTTQDIDRLVNVLISK
jgi:selenocysteine lyase/cysteine desulfurase